VSFGRGPFFALYGPNSISRSPKKKKKKEARCWASANASPIARAGPQAAVGQKVSRGLFKHSANFFIFLFYFSEAFNICFAQLLISI
jgi:hypothetical protein